MIVPTVAITITMLITVAKGIPRVRKAYGMPTIPPPIQVLISASIPVNTVKPYSLAIIENLLLILLVEVPS